MSNRTAILAYRHRRRRPDDQDDVALAATTTLPIGVKHKRRHARRGSEDQAQIAKLEAQRRERRKADEEQLRQQIPRVSISVRSEAVSGVVVSTGEVAWTPGRALYELPSRVQQLIGNAYKKLTGQAKPVPVVEAKRPPRQTVALLGQQGSVAVAAVSVSAEPPVADASIQILQQMHVSCAVHTLRYGPQKVLDQLIQIGAFEAL